MAKRYNIPEDIHLHRIDSDHSTESGNEMTDKLETVITETDVSFPEGNAELTVDDNMVMRHRRATSDTGGNRRSSKDPKKTMTAESNERITTRFSNYWQKVVEKNIESNKATHLIDEISRYTFPISFAVFNALYFVVVFLIHEGRVR